MSLKVLYVDTEALEDAIQKSGRKKGYICEKLELSKAGFWKKLNGKTPFKAVEVNFLCDLLNIPEEDKAKIFKPKVED